MLKPVRNTDLFDNFNYAPIGGKCEINYNTIVSVPLLRSILEKQEGHLSEIFEGGYFILNKKEQYIELLKNKGGRLLKKFISNDNDNYIFIWKDGVVDLNFTNNYLEVGALSHNEKFIVEIKEFFDKEWVPAEKEKGHIYAIMRNGPNLSLSTIGNAGIPLEAGNYADKVIEDYRFIVKDLQATSPSGRIIIMEGCPGSGKTHLVRAMLMEVPDAMFVLVSPEMITSLAGPELLPLLLNYKGGLSGPIILILEDADKCLVARDGNNMNSIQSLLNLGDGILGSLLDLRIVATTNAKKMEMEEAILRPGRLSKRLEVGRIDINTALNIFNRLLPSVSTPVELTLIKSNGIKLEMTLAEVYALARKYGWAPESRKESSDANKDQDSFDDFIDDDNDE